MLYESGGPWPSLLGYPRVAGPGWCNSRKYLFIILSLNSPEHIVEINRDSASKHKTGGSIRQRSSWRIYQTKVVMEDLSDKDRHGDYVFQWQGIACSRKMCLVVSISVPQLHTSLKQSLNVWRNLSLFKWLTLVKTL